LWSGDDRSSRRVVFGVNTLLVSDFEVCVCHSSGCILSRVRMLKVGGGIEPPSCHPN
jgi:hypothetical protein